jgi:hypothetical protein
MLVAKLYDGNASLEEAVSHLFVRDLIDQRSVGVCSKW